MRNFIVTSYYTLNTPYQKVAHDYLMKTVADLKMESDIRGISTLGNWQRNTLFKPTFVKHMLEMHPDKNVVFLDADAEILKYPELFDKIPEDCNLAVHYLDRDKWYNRNFGEPRELLSGTLFVQNTPEAKCIVEMWEQACSSHKMVWEQYLLQATVEKHHIKVYELPVEYAWIKTLPNGDTPFVKPNGDIIIRHNQVSRTLKKKVAII
jgi:hypothetical protein